MNSKFDNRDGTVTVTKFSGTCDYNKWVRLIILDLTCFNVS